MASWQEKPYINASVWCLEYGNGIIYHIDYDNDLVYVDYYLKGKHTHDLDDFTGTFNERANQFQIEPL